MRDFFGNEFRLTRERWQHIISRHPEIKGKKQEIQRILIDPDVLVATVRNKNIVIYQRRYKKKYYFAVIIHNQEGFIITAFINDKIKRGEIIWRKEETNN